MEEIWKQIDNFPDYEISNLGRIKSFKRYKNGKILKLIKNKYGYLFIRLYKNGKPKPKLIHILIFENFNNYKLKSDECVHHINENPLDNDFNNFKLMTKLEHNIFHKSGEKNYWFGKKHYEHSKRISGENNPNYKLEEWNKSIYQISNSPIIKQLKITQKEIAEIFSVKRLTISRIKNKKSWTYIMETL